MGEVDVDRFHIAHVLNHRSVPHSTAAAIYDRYWYDKEKRAALEKWAEILSAIVDVKPPPAIPIHRQNVYEFTPQATRRIGARVHRASREAMTLAVGSAVSAYADYFETRHRLIVPKSEPLIACP